MTMTTAIPAFDPESSDAEILEAFEKVRASRSWSYSFDGLYLSDPPAWDRVNEEIEEKEPAAVEGEAMVRKNWATTPSGVACQIVLSMMDGGNARWVDRGVMEHGILALYAAKGDLDGHDQTLITTAYELLHIEWEDALAAFQQSDPIYDLALEMEDAVVALGRKLPVAHQPAFDILRELVKRNEELTSNNSQLNRLMRTLAPDWPSYKRKAEIMLAEAYADKAAPWLVRDVNFLTGAIIHDAAEQREAV